MMMCESCLTGCTICEHEDEEPLDKQEEKVYNISLEDRDWLVKVLSSILDEDFYTVEWGKKCQEVLDKLKNFC